MTGASKTGEPAGLMRRVILLVCLLGCGNDNAGLVGMVTGGAGGAQGGGGGGGSVPTGGSGPPSPGTGGAVATGGSPAGGSLGTGGMAVTGGASGTGGADATGGSGTGGTGGSSMVGAGSCQNNPEWACINGVSKFPWRCVGGSCSTQDADCKPLIGVVLVCMAPGSGPTTQLYAGRAMPCRADLDCGGPNSEIGCNEQHLCGGHGGYPCKDGFQCYSGVCRDNYCAGIRKSGESCRIATDCLSGKCTSQMFCQ